MYIIQSAFKSFFTTLYSVLMIIDGMIILGYTYLHFVYFHVALNCTLSVNISKFRWNKKTRTILKKNERKFDKNGSKDCKNMLLLGTMRQSGWKDANARNKYFICEHFKR